MKLSLPLALSALLALSVPAFAGDMDEGPTSFALPSGNIACWYTPPGELPTQGAGLFCERADPSRVRVLMGEQGRAEIERHYRDARCCGADSALGYGETWRLGPFACNAAENGLTCRSEAGHGLFLSKARVEAW